jgi:hypothetical protein
MHERAQGPSSGMVGYPQPDEVVETPKAPYLVHQLSVFQTAN